MSENLEKNNPFSGLLSNNEDIVNNRLVPDCESSDTANDTIKGVFLINKVIEEVFHLTLNKQSKGNEESDPQLIYLEETAEKIAPQDWFELENFENALFERLLMSDPLKHIRNRKSLVEINVHATSNKIIIYLFECYKRLMNISLRSEYNDEISSVDLMKKLTLRNVVTALKQPDLYFEQELHVQILDLFSEETNSKTDYSHFFNDLVKEFIIDCDNEDITQVLHEAFSPTLEKITSDVLNNNILTYNQSYFKLLNVFSENTELAVLLVNYSTPSANALGREYTSTLFGCFLSLSCIPKSPDKPHEFFSSSIGSSVSVEEENIWTNLKLVSVNIYNIFHNLLKLTKSRDCLLNWIGSCLDANSPRGTVWGTFMNHNQFMVVSDGFMMNLVSVMLRLCHPFCLEPSNILLLKIDPTYCALETSDKLLFSKKLHKLTCLIPAEDFKRPVVQKYNFMTECFFLTHRALELGLNVCLQSLMRIGQDLSQLTSAYEDALQQVAATSDVMRAMRDRLETEMTKYHSIKAIVLEPETISMLSELYLATAVWLIQIVMDSESTVEEKDSYAPLIFRELQFPLPENVPKTLSCIPECLIENIVIFLGFIRRSRPRILEEKGLKFLCPFLSLPMIFMGDSQRARNPHLRARLAEMMESLLPQSPKEPHEPTLEMVGTFYRGRLFKQHPHRNQVVQCLLNVFVGIEMTGQSVAFEQKFNYRRPMYIIMDYLWKITEHQECFKMLAVEAERNMEAVSPPLFLGFINLLINDAVFLLDEALNNMAQIRKLQTERENGSWQQLPIPEREQQEQHFQQLGMMARFDNILGRETIHTLQFLTTEITTIFCHPTFVDRIAAMLNYFLFNLVGPKMKNFKVKDLKAYEFEPANIVMDICKIYLNLEHSDAFCLAVSQDGRSYTPKLFSLAEDVLARIGGGILISDLQKLASKVSRLASQQTTEEEILSEVPDEYLDPIMSTIMWDPVILPSSNTRVDRSTIARHLLSDQTDPFNRSPLTMDMVKSDTELRQAIETWAAEKRNLSQKSENDKS